MLLFKCCLSGSGGCELAEGSQRGGSVFLSLGDGWGMRLGFILAEGRMAVTGGPGEPAWYFGFYPLPSCWPPTAPVSWFQVRLLGGRRQGQDWHYDCMIENFSFCCFIFFTGGVGRGRIPAILLCWRRDPTVGSLPFPPCFVLCLWLELGTSPRRDRTGTVLCSPAPGSPGLCRDSHSTSTFLSLFSFFLPLSLLAVTPSPLHSIRPSHSCACWHFTGRPPSKRQICTVFYFPEQQQQQKVPNAARSCSRWPKLSKKLSKYISFSVPGAPAAPWAEQRGSCSARSGDSRSPSGQEPSGFCPFP